MEALGRLSDPRAVPPLGALLEDEGSAEAVAALAMLASSPGARCAVLSACRARPLPLSPGWSRLLGGVGEADDAAALLGSLAGPAPVRAAAAAALAALGARTGGVEAPPAALLQALEDADPGVRAGAAQALGALGGRARVEATRDRGGVARALALALHDAEPAVRAAAAAAMGRLGARQHAGPLVELAGDWAAPPEVAAAAVRALAAMGAATPEVLARAAQHADAEVVKEAVRAASALPGGAIEDLLRGAAGHPRWDVRLAVATALEERADPAALPALRLLAAAEVDAAVERALVRAIRALEGLAALSAAAGAATPAERPPR